MTGLEILLALAGIAVMGLVVAGMILITPLGEQAVHTDGARGERLEPEPRGGRPRRAASAPRNAADAAVSAPTSHRAAGTMVRRHSTGVDMVIEGWR